MVVPAFTCRPTCTEPVSSTTLLPLLAPAPSLAEHAAKPAPPSSPAKAKAIHHRPFASWDSRIVLSFDVSAVTVVAPMNQVQQPLGNKLATTPETKPVKFGH
jgi:hypothetical protein